MAQLSLVLRHHVEQGIGHGDLPTKDDHQGNDDGPDGHQEEDAVGERVQARERDFLGSGKSWGGDHEEEKPKTPHESSPHKVVTRM